MNNEDFVGVDKVNLKLLLDTIASIQNDFETQVGWLQQDIQNLQSSIAKLDSRISNLENYKTRDLQTDVYRLEDKIRSLESDISSVKRGW